VAVTTSLHKFAVEEGFVNNVGGMRVLRVGIDARCVLYPILHGYQLLTEGKWLDLPCVLPARGNEESRIVNSICLVHAAAADARLTHVHIRWERTPKTETWQDCSWKCTLDHSGYESNA
jgi:hypothetical protein